MEREPGARMNDDGIGGRDRIGILRRGPVVAPQGNLRAVHRQRPAHAIQVVAVGNRHHIGPGRPVRVGHGRAVRHDVSNISVVGVARLEPEHFGRSIQHPIFLGPARHIGQGHKIPQLNQRDGEIVARHRLAGRGDAFRQLPGDGQMHIPPEDNIASFGARDVFAVPPPFVEQRDDGIPQHVAREVALRHIGRRGQISAQVGRRHVSHG